MKRKNKIKKIMIWILLVTSLSCFIYLFREFIPTPIHILTLLLIAIALALLINTKRLKDSRNPFGNISGSGDFHGHLEYKNIKKQVYETETRPGKTH